jgi:hypothetical protein
MLRLRTEIDGMLWLLTAYILLKYPLTSSQQGKTMSVLIEISNIETDIYYVLVNTLNAEAIGMWGVVSSLCTFCNSRPRQVVPMHHVQWDQVEMPVI